jgi:hypothetical protein
VTVKKISTRRCFSQIEREKRMRFRLIRNQIWKKRYNTTLTGKNSCCGSRRLLLLPKYQENCTDCSLQKQKTVGLLSSSSTTQHTEIASCASLVGSALFKSDQKVTAEDIAKICDPLDEISTDPNLFVSREFELRRRASSILLPWAFPSCSSPRRLLSSRSAPRSELLRHPRIR